jgi:ubiquinone/menaquinone biosynthesis C-methylase UbiE
MDISDRMLLRARAANAMLKHVAFSCGSSEHLPFADNFFSKALSVEAFYYFENQEKALAELQRVLVPSGRLFVLICLYKDHQDSLATVHDVNVPVHVRSIQEYEELFRSQGWQNVQSHEFIRQRTNGEKRDVHDRALLLSAQKPGVEMAPHAGVEASVSQSA